MFAIISRTRSRFSFPFVNSFSSFLLFHISHIYLERWNAVTVFASKRMKIVYLSTKNSGLKISFYTECAVFIFNNTIQFKNQAFEDLSFFGLHMFSLFTYTLFSFVAYQFSSVLLYLQLEWRNVRTNTSQFGIAFSSVVLCEPIWKIENRTKRWTVKNILPSG